MSNCVNQTFLNTGMAGIGAQRNYFFAPDINSSNIEVINANLNAGNNTFGLVQPNGKTTKFKNSNIANIRSGPFIDQPTTFTASGIEARKVFNTYATAQSTSGLDVAQDGVYDLLSSGIAGITETFASVENYVGGNFTDVSLTPTTGHVTFGPIGRGVGYTATGSTYTSQTGFAKLETSGDTMELEIPFAMHGITSFQNVSPLLFVDAQGAIANNHAVFNQSGVTGGTFTITVKDSSGTSLGTTPAQAFNVTAANLQVAIRALNASINLSVVSGSLSSGFAITLTGTAAYFGIVEVNGALLTGGTDPATAYAVGRPRLLTGEAFGSGLSCDFAVKTPSGSYGTYQSLTASNLSTAISGLSGYDAGTGLHMKVKLTSNSTNPYNSIWQISMPTNIDTSLWTVYDAYINLLNVNPTDIVELRRVSDNTVIQSWTGGGVKEFTVVGDFARQAYFVRKTSGGTILKSTVATPITLTVNDNGSADLKESLVSVAGVLSTETCEMRLESTDAVVYTRTGSGNFTLFDTDIATVVYFVRLSGGIVVSSSKATPKTLTIGNNGTVNLFTGDEVQLAQAPELVEINTNLPKVNRNVIKASKLIPAGETF
jgi:hypothetical protein